MPLYEFYCPDCHAVFTFLSRAINTTARPACPACSRPALSRRVSRFAVVRPGRTEAETEGMGDVDEARLEQALMDMTGDMDKVDPEDPRQAARMMRALYDRAGLRMDGAAGEILRRMEAGEDPEELEERFADMDEEIEEPALLSVRRRLLAPPRRDETIYDLE